MPFSDPIQRREYGQKYNQQKRKANRLIVFGHYSNQTYRCECCGEPEIEFLQIDHIANDGAAHRREIASLLGRKQGPRGSLMHEWLIANGLPEGFQVLCANCNTAKAKFGVCPHQATRNES